MDKEKLEEFIILFKRLKNEVNDSPKTLSWISERKSDIAELSYSLYRLYHQIELFKSIKQDWAFFHPSGFDEELEDFEQRFKGIVHSIYNPVADKKNEEFINQLKDICNNQGKDFDIILEDIRKSTDKDAYFDFDPKEDNPGVCIENAIWDFADIGENLPEEFQKTADMALEAWRYIKTSMKIELKEIADRRNAVKDLFIEYNRLKRHPGALIELYNESVRSFLYGHKISAVIVSRSILEHVLENYYHIVGQNLVSKKGKKRFDRSLWAKIEEAELRIDSFDIKGLELHKKREFARDVVHKYTSDQVIQDQFIIDFLKAIRILVQHVPKEDESSSN
jgi:hypothetical protein